MLVSIVGTATAPTHGHSIYLTIFSRDMKVLPDWYLSRVEAPLINAKWMRSQLAAYRPHALLALERIKRCKNDANHLIVFDRINSSQP